MDDGTTENDARAGALDRVALQEVVETLRQIAADQGRADLVVRLDEAAWRVARTEILVCVVGEFKKGKSALTNAILGRSVCPVDDDLATAAVTVIRHDDPPSVTVRRRSDTGVVAEVVEPADVARWVVEHGDAGRRHDVVLVEIGLPHPLLSRGIALVDTPGVGGLNAAHALATLAFLPSADAVVFVTDASAELTGPELEFLSRAVKAGPPILLAVTKIDMYPEWRRIVTLDRDHLRAAGMDLEPRPVSSVLSEVARDGDQVLAEWSGVPRLLETLLGTVSEDAGRRALATASADIVLAIGQVREPLVAELAALEHPERADAMTVRLQSVRDRLAVLSEADAHWSLQVDDGFEELRTRVRFSFQSRIRRCLRDAQEEVDRFDPAHGWPDLSGRFQGDVAAIVRAAFVDVTDGAAAIQAVIAALLADEGQATGPRADQPVGFDVTTLWSADPAFTARSRTRPLGQLGVYAGATLFAASLGTVGLEMVGLLGSLLGAAIVGPAVVGVALARGGKQVVDARHRQLADRRQDARAFLAHFMEDVQFEVDGRLGTMIGDLQRQMRSHFVRRIGELRRTNEAGIRALERTAEQDDGESRARIEELRSGVGVLDRLRARVDAAGQDPRQVDRGPESRPGPTGAAANP